MWWHHPIDVYLPGALSHQVLPYSLRSSKKAIMDELTRTRAGPSCNSLTLDLLRTCRQIYMEAALLYFSHNIFAFPTRAMIIAFLRTIALEQRQAITEIGTVWAIPKVLCKDLKNLKHVYLTALPCQLSTRYTYREPDVEEFWRGCAGVKVHIEW